MEGSPKALTGLPEGDYGENEKPSAEKEKKWEEG